MRVSAKPFYEKSHEKKEYHEADDEQPTLILLCFLCSSHLLLRYSLSKLLEVYCNRILSIAHIFILEAAICIL